MRDDTRNSVVVGTFVLAMLVALITWIHDDGAGKGGALQLDDRGRERHAAAR